MVKKGIGGEVGEKLCQYSLYRVEAVQGNSAMSLRDLFPGKYILINLQSVHKNQQE